MFGFRLSHLTRAEIEDLLAEKFQDDHVVLAQGLVGLGCANDVGDEALPVLRPLPLKNGDQDEVELVKVRPLLLHQVRT